jgi:ABC-type bacteriocin/lantibiotic exporter with double-glycine peptidase domain
MKLIRQKEKNDCAIACLAMVSGIPYDEAYTMLRSEKYVWLRDLPTPRRYVFNALRELGMQYEIVYDGSFVDHRSMVFVRCDRSNHVVVYDAETRRILDPWPDDPLCLEYCLANLSCAAMLIG